LTEVSVKFLGCGDNFGSGGRFQTCIFVQSRAAKFLIDCGASSLIAMKQFGVSPLDVETILITHLHGDHFAGIPFFILDSQLISRRSVERRLTRFGWSALEKQLFTPAIRNGPIP
jgi:ribonuclease BN (tRNA processing enzyme)